RWQYKLKYDVFISVKQTDKTEGKTHPTEDYRVGLELYDHLTSLGLKVFNSEKTKGPAGKEWEPYILAALMSARVMIVVGTCPKYMESQWVKNEWTRFQWLQKYERDEKKERVLFCYLSGGMKAEQIPKALNPNKQAIIDGIHAQTELDAVIKGIFPPPPPSNENESRKKTEKPPKPPITEEQLLANWEAWLRLGGKDYIDKIKTDYASMVARGEHLTNPTFHLLSLCAENKVPSIRELPQSISNLQKESKFLLADQCAVSEEDRKLIDSLKKACAEEKDKKKKEKKNKAYAVISLVSAAVICAFLIALYFVEPNADVLKRDTHIEAILLGGAAVVVLLAFVLFRILRRLSQSKCTMANSETRLYGFIHLCVCLFALIGVLNAGENIWNGWVLGVWAHYYEQYTIHLVEIYIFAASILISATGAIMTIVQRNRNSVSD
nr:toll/interleukin-1 receptor domain-containing protein [Oscillospiraceae bacterium]